MLTPAMRASRTSEPLVIIENALATHVRPSVSFDRLPLAAAMTTGLTARVMTAGAWPKPTCGVAAARAAAAPVRTKSRRLIVLLMAPLPGFAGSIFHVAVDQTETGRRMYAGPAAGVKRACRLKKELG